MRKKDSISGEDLRPALDRVVLVTLTPLGLAAGISSLLLTVLHFVYLPASTALPIAMSTLLGAIVLLGIGVAAYLGRIPAKWAHAMMCLGLAVVSVTLLLLLALTGEAKQSTNIAITIVIAGCFVLSRRWLVGTVLAVLGAWVAVAAYCVADPDWMHYGLLMGEAGTISILVHLIRVSTLTEIERHHAEEQERLVRRQRLESAIFELSRDATLAQGDFAAAAQRISEVAAEALDVERVGVWLLSDRDTRATCVELFDRSSHSHLSGVVLHLGERGNYVQTLVSGRVAEVRDVAADPRANGYADGGVQLQRATSILDAPVRQTGAVSGFVSFEHVGTARSWSGEEQVFAAEVGDLVARAVLNRERKEQEENLRASEEQYRTTLDSMGDVIFVVDRRLHIVLANERCAAWRDELGLEPDAVGMPLYAAFEFLPERMRSEYEGVFETGQMHFTEEAISAGGHSYIIETRKIPLLSGGRVSQVVTVMRDITERMRIEAENAILEARMQQTQRLESLGALAGGIAHDFNNLLTMILGNANVIEQHATGSEQLCEAAEVIREAAERGGRLTRQLLGFARQGKYRNEAVDVQAVIQSLQELLASTLDKRIGCAFDMRAEHHTVLGDPSQVEQVFLNLFLNAADAMPEGGRLTVRTSEQNVGEAEVIRGEEVTPGRYLQVEVCDTGVGIAPEDVGRIFDPFYTTKDVGKGTGLGLATVYGVVCNHRGYVGVDSKQGGGTTFTVLLPLSDAPLEEERQEAPERSAPRPNGRILIVDDEQFVRVTLGRMLTLLGYEHAEAADGHAAIERYTGDGKAIDLVIVDMMMPDMDGAACFRALREADPEAKVILATGYDRSQAVEQLLTEGLVGFLQKPFSVDELESMLREALA